MLQPLVIIIAKLRSTFSQTNVVGQSLLELRRVGRTMHLDIAGVLDHILVTLRAVELPQVRSCRQQKAAEA